jgi:hypothetical protein
MQITKTKLFLGGAVLLGLGAFATAGTLAVFADPTNESTGNTFTTGVISFSQDKPNGILTYTSSGGMMPGQVTNGEVVVTNDTGSGANNQLRYSITSSISGDAGLAAALLLTVKLTDDNTPGGVCTNFTGNTLYSGDLDGGTGGNVVGDPARGQYDDGSPTTYNDDRLINAGASEKVCFRVSLSLETTGDALEGKTVTATFNFAAEQTLYNP